LGIGHWALGIGHWANLGIIIKFHLIKRIILKYDSFFVYLSYIYQKQFSFKNLGMKSILAFILLAFLSTSTFSQKSRATGKAFNYAKIFDFSKCDDKKSINSAYYNQLKTHIFKNIDQETFDFIGNNLSTKDSTYTLGLTYWKNKKRF